MNKFLQDRIIPYQGTDSFPLGMSLDEARTMLKSNKIPFSQSVRSNKGCSPEVPWTLIQFADSITLCFADGILFEIILEQQYQGLLPNGIGIGTNMADVSNYDSSLEYNEEDDDYISKEGYWIENDSQTHKVISITIFVKEAENPASFFTYAWLNNYKRP